MLKRILFVLVAVVASAAVAQDANDPLFLWEQATLYRDAWGTPHVYADNPRAQAFAFGYAQAEDHIETVLMAYRMASGRAAEVVGEPASGSDAFALKMRHYDLAIEAYGQADALTLDLCEGFALGVNTWLLENRAQAPPWTTGVSPADVLALMHAFLMGMAPLDLPGIAKRASPMPSANAWAVGPEGSKSGDAMLVINPHAQYDGVFQWYEAHLATGGLNVAGATVLGLPVLLQGHNETLGWALAPNAPDFADVYVEFGPPFPVRDPKTATPAQLNLEQAYAPMLASEARHYFVRSDTGFERRYVRRLSSSRGPVIDSREGRNLVYRVGGYGQFGTLRQLFRMGEAQSLDEFRNALSLRQLPCFHIVYADQRGNIFYLYNATVGEKQDVGFSAGPEALNARSAWDSPVSAKDPAYDWGPLIPFESLPSLLNPMSGYLQACGTPPWRVTDNMEMGPSDWPRWFVRDPDTYRARRTRQLLSQGARTFVDNQAMLYDLVAPFAVDAVPYLLDMAAKYPEFVVNAHPDLPAALDMLRGWNRLAEPGSMAMTFFHVWWTAFQAYYGPEAIQSPHRLYGLFEQDSPMVGQNALRAASDAAKLMRNEFQSINVPWGEVHRVRRGGRDMPSGGSVSGESLFVASDSRFINGTWPVEYGLGYAMVVRFGEKVEAVSVLAFGTSGDPASPHYDDQFDLVLERRFKVTRFYREDVEAHARTARGRILRIRRGSNAKYLLRAAAPVTARVAASVEAPAELPAGLVTFTPYSTVTLDVRNVPAEVAFELTVPEAICDREDLARLRVFFYHRQGGQWLRIADQRLKWEGRSFVGRAAPGETFAVLGSAKYRKSKPGMEEAYVNREAERALVAKKPAPDKMNDAGIAESVRLPERSAALPEVTAEVTATPAPETAESGEGEVEVRTPEPVQKKGRLTWSMKPLSELRQAPVKQNPLPFLVSELTQASPMSVGKNLQLRAPVGRALFHLTMLKTVRARVAIEENPAPFPENLAACTPVFNVVCAPAGVVGTTAISIQVDPRICAPEHLEHLELYFYDEAEGWRPMPKQKVSGGGQVYTAIDFKPRIYAVLAPAEYLAESTP